MRRGLELHLGVVRLRLRVEGLFLGWFASGEYGYPKRSFVHLLCHFLTLSQTHQLKCQSLGLPLDDAQLLDVLKLLSVVDGLLDLAKPSDAQV